MASGRVHDKWSPFPEEINRKLTGAIADLHFCPTVSNRDNLARENITDGVFVTGNTVIDALQPAATASGRSVSRRRTSTGLPRAGASS